MFSISKVHSSDKINITKYKLAKKNFWILESTKINFRGERQTGSSLNVVGVGKGDKTNEQRYCRSPGLDSLPPELFVHFWSLLGPLLLNMVNSAISVGSFPTSSNIAVITLLLKKDNPPTDCSSYRPLSLLNWEIKFFAEALASRLEYYLHHFIHHDQTGFIKSRLASDSVRRLLHLT